MAHNDPSSPNPGLLLRDVTRLHLRAQRQQVWCCGVASSAQCNILTELGRTGPISVTALGRQLGVDKGWISRGVAELVASGLVLRGGSPRDRRNVIVGLTAAGRRRLAALNRNLDRHSMRILGRVPTRERPLVREALSHLVRALEQELAGSKGALSGAGRHRPSQSRAPRAA